MRGERKIDALATFVAVQQDYPITEVILEVIRKLADHPVVILQAPPGAGKSTVLPLSLLEEKTSGKIIMLEPRRLAARSVAMRMASVLNEQVGERVGYRVRFDTQVTGRTQLEVVTEGILTRMMQTDPTLEGVRLLIFDEFHERSLHADLALTLSLQLQQLMRPDLKILIMSATLDAANLSAILGQAPVITSQGKQHPVRMQYIEREDGAPLTERTVSAVLKAAKENDGDILVFLPGAGEIKRVEELLNERQRAATVYPLYGDLSFQDQQAAIMPRTDGVRKIVLATSIAETSLTIEGVTVVVDCGLARVPRFDPRSGLMRLETIRVTADAADQRAGRAGRLGPGVCYRMWTQATQRNLAPQRRPEILEADLASLLLELAQWGCEDIFSLTWITPPPAGPVQQAKELLQQLEALEGNRITSRGKEMLRLPTHPRLSHLLLRARTPEEKQVACDLIAILEEKDPLGEDAGADVALRLEYLWKQAATGRLNGRLERIDRIARQWRNLMRWDARPMGLKSDAAGSLLVAAYPERIAKQRERHSTYFTLANGRVVKLRDHDPLINESWLCAAEVDAGTKGEGRIFMAAAVSPDEVASMATIVEAAGWDEQRLMITARRESRIGTLLLKSESLPAISDEELLKEWQRVMQERGIQWLKPDDNFRALQARMQSVRHWHPDGQWPDVSDVALSNDITWLANSLHGITKFSELQRIELADALLRSISWELRKQLDSLAPERLEVPSGSAILVQYFEDGRTPVMEVRLQEVFGMLDTPAVDNGRKKILMHLLSPGYKPVQVTQDLRSFWQGLYHEVRSELKRRYPKHSWPEDPFTAKAVRLGRSVRGGRG